MNKLSTPLRVTVVTSYYPPDFASISNYYKDLVTDLSAFGAVVTLVCGIPTRLVTDEITKQYAKNPVEVISENLRIIRTGPPRSEGRNLVYRAFYHIYRSWCVYRKAREIETDLYYVCSTPPFLGVFGALLSKRARTIYDLHDVFPDTLVNSGKVKENSVLVKVLRRVEKYVYKRNTHIRIISEDMADTLRSRGVPDDKISIIYNWVDENAVTYIERRNNPIFDSLGIPREGFYACYAGNIGLLQNLTTLINAAEVLKEKEPLIRFIIIGDGAWKQEMLAQISDKGLDNISVFPMQDTEHVPYVYNIADIGVVTIAKGVTKGSLPSKTWSIMSASRPVLCETDKGSELEKIIAGNNCGLCVPPGDVKGFVGAVMALYDDRDLVAEMGRNGRTFVENNITRGNSTKKIWACVQNVVNGCE